MPNTPGITSRNGASLGYSYRPTSSRPSQDNTIEVLKRENVYAVKTTSGKTHVTEITHAPGSVSKEIKSSCCSCLKVESFLSEARVAREKKPEEVTLDFLRNDIYFSDQAVDLAEACIAKAKEGQGTTGFGYELYTNAALIALNTLTGDLTIGDDFLIEVQSYIENQMLNDMLVDKIEDSHNIEALFTAANEKIQTRPLIGMKDLPTSILSWSKWFSLSIESNNTQADNTTKKSIQSKLLEFRNNAVRSLQEYIEASKDYKLETDDFQSDALKELKKFKGISENHTYERPPHEKGQTSPFDGVPIVEGLPYTIPPFHGKLSEAREAFEFHLTAFETLCKRIMDNEHPGEENNFSCSTQSRPIRHNNRSLRSFQANSDGSKTCWTSFRRGFSAVFNYIGRFKDDLAVQNTKRLVDASIVGKAVVRDFAWVSNQVLDVIARSEETAEVLKSLVRTDKDSFSITVNTKDGTTGNPINGVIQSTSFNTTAEGIDSFTLSNYKKIESNRELDNNLQCALKTAKDKLSTNNDVIPSKEFFSQLITAFFIELSEFDADINPRTAELLRKYQSAKDNGELRATRISDLVAEGVSNAIIEILKSEDIEVNLDKIDQKGKTTLSKYIKAGKDFVLRTIVEDLIKTEERPDIGYQATQTPKSFDLIVNANRDLDEIDESAKAAGGGNAPGTLKEANAKAFTIQDALQKEFWEPRIVAKNDVKGLVDDIKPKDQSVELLKADFIKRTPNYRLTNVLKLISDDYNKLPEEIRNAIEGENGINTKKLKNALPAKCKIEDDLLDDCSDTIKREDKKRFQEYVQGIAGKIENDIPSSDIIKELIGLIKTFQVNQPAGFDQFLDANFWDELDVDSLDDVLSKGVAEFPLIIELHAKLNKKGIVELAKAVEKCESGDNQGAVSIMRVLIENNKVKEGFGKEGPASEEAKETGSGSHDTSAASGKNNQGETAKGVRASDGDGDGDHGGDGDEDDGDSSDWSET